MNRPNPFSPPAYGGLEQSGLDYFPQDYTPVIDIAMTANQRLAAQAVNIDNDADFDWRAIYITGTEGSFTLRLYDSNFFALSNQELSSSNFFQNDGPIPFVIAPSIIIPAGGSIQFDITDTSGANNNVQIAFRGVKLFKLQ